MKHGNDSQIVCFPKVSPKQHFYFVFFREKFTAYFGAAGSAFSLLLVLKFIPKNTKAETTRGNTTGKTCLLLLNLMFSAVWEVYTKWPWVHDHNNPVFVIFSLKNYDSVLTLFFFLSHF